MKAYENDEKNVEMVHTFVQLPMHIYQAMVDGCRLCVVPTSAFLLERTSNVNRGLKLGTEEREGPFGGRVWRCS